MPEEQVIHSDGEHFKAIENACFEKAGFTKEKIELINGNPALTPFATMTRFIDTKHCLFKPVTHRQFRYLTKYVMKRLS
jgi:hypothetical protein